MRKAILVEAERIRQVLIADGPLTTDDLAYLDAWGRWERDGLA
jgi:hypothetical protein